jgi:hypothetical protein
VVVVLPASIWAIMPMLRMSESFMLSPGRMTGIRYLIHEYVAKDKDRRDFYSAQKVVKLVNLDVYIAICKRLEGHERIDYLKNTEMVSRRFGYVDAVINIHLLLVLSLFKSLNSHSWSFD